MGGSNSAQLNLCSSVHRIILNPTLSQNLSGDLIQAINELFPSSKFEFREVLSFDRPVRKIVALSKPNRDKLKIFEFDCLEVTETKDVLDTIKEWYDEQTNLSTENKSTKEVIKFLTPKHCTCCGAPLKTGATSCMYCGVDYS